MADDVRIVVCDALCFLQNKFGNTTVKQLKTAVLDFYNIEVIVNAKQQLVVDVEVLESADEKSLKFPQIARRRAGDNRLVGEVDDIFTLITFLDENKLLCALPKYVANGPDYMPSLRIYEGEMGILTAMLKTLNDKIMEYGSAIASLAHEVKVLQTAQRPPVATSSATTMAAAVPSNGQQQPLPPRGVYQYRADDRSAVPPPSTLLSLVEFPAIGQSSSNVVVQSADQLPPPGTDWATLASTPFAHRNRYGPLSSLDGDADEQSDSAPAAAGSRRGQFTTVVSRKKRARTSPPQPTLNAGSSTEAQRRTSAVLGKSRSSNVKLIAAKHIRKKSVFCVDNVNMSCTTKDIEAYVEKELSINVLSCFEAKSRRRRSDDDDSVANRKAFRLCVCEDDRSRLLDAIAWPDSVIVSEWFFKAKQSDEDKRFKMKTRRDEQRSSVNHVQQQAAGDAAAAAAAVAVMSAAQADAYSDDTILAAADMDCLGDGS